MRSGALRVLALDTATPFLCLGLLTVDGEAERIAFESAERVERAHDERAMGAVERLFAGAGLEPGADLLAVGTGPGSYTGVRVGASLALGLARAWGASIVGVPTLEAVAAEGEGLVAASLDARKGNVYGAVYRVEAGAATVLEPVAKRPLEDFAALVPPGAAWRRDEAPGGLALARLGLRRWRSGKAGELELSYL